MRWYWWMLLLAATGGVGYYLWKKLGTKQSGTTGDLSSMVWRTAGSGGAGPIGGGYEGGGESGLRIALDPRVPLETRQSAPLTTSSRSSPVVVKAPITVLRADSNPVIVSAELRSPTAARDEALGPVRR